MAHLLNTLNLEEFEKRIFLVGGYRVRKGQHYWIFGKKPKRDYYLYNTRFSVTEEPCRNGSMGTGERPDFVILYDFFHPEKVRVFSCKEYYIKTSAELKAMGYPNPNENSYIVYRLGEEFDASQINVRAIVEYAHDKYPAYKKKDEVIPVAVTGEDILRVNKGELPLLDGRKDIRIIDLFAGLGGFHHAFDKLGKEMGFRVNCVYVSELKEDLRHLYETNYGIPYEKINDDITKLKNDNIIKEEVPEHDILCAGFPCQPFSKAGKQQGFNDEEGRGILFNYIAEIIRVRRPKYIFLENVANLESHDGGNTWDIIRYRLSKRIEDGGLDYEIQWKVLSPHDFGLPQHRKRIYIVGQAREQIDGVFNFEFPEKPAEVTCNIRTIIEENPKDFIPIVKPYKRYIEIWQDFLDRVVESGAKLPNAPIWSMEFGADYPYEKIAPSKSTAKVLRGHHGRLGEKISGSSLEECLEHLPNYSKKSKTEVFPDWKKKFIRENRNFYKANKEWLDDWKKQLEGLDDSFIKFEWNCPEGENMTMDDKILQFRPSGLRVKLPNYSPALTFMASQVPIYPWVEYELPDGTKGRGRYMSIKEGAKLQGMEQLSFRGLKKPRIYEALGNAINVEMIRIIAKQIFIPHH